MDELPVTLAGVLAAQAGMAGQIVHTPRSGGAIVAALAAKGYDVGVRRA
jgi:hypothetical protein